MPTNNILLNIPSLYGRITYLFNAITSDAYELQAAYSGTNVNQVFESGTFRSTTVSLGSNPAVGSKPPLSPPSFDSANINIDGIKQPYVTLNFSINPQTIQGASIVSFKIYRQQVQAEDLAQEVEMFEASDFDKLAQGTGPVGEYSSQNKAQFAVNSQLQSQINQNTNLYLLQSTNNSQQLGTTTASFPDYFAPLTNTGSMDNTLIATVNYQDYEASAQLKQVYVQSTTTASFSYDDHNVTWGSAYVYTITSYSSTSEESQPSEGISMVVMNLNGIDPPQNVTVKQSSGELAHINVQVNPADLIKNVYVFRRDQNDLVFHPFALAGNANNYITIYDDETIYLQTYIYRILLENVFGVVSEPVETTFTCTQQDYISKTRSNNLALPILLASQDQNSQGIKLTIFPNDSRVLYYTLERRNLTAGETTFSVPTNKTNTFWPVNQFFVTQSSGSISGSILSSGTLSNITSGTLPAQAQFIQFSDPIVFVDTIVSPDNVYQYRTVGYDVYGNATGYGFATLAALAKDALRAPINFQFELLRESPYRIALTWDDDNQAALSNQQNQAQQNYLALALAQANLSQAQQTFVEQMTSGQDLTTVDLTSLLAPYNVQQAQITAIQNQLNALSNTTNPLKFQLQRRLQGDTQYDSWPLTENNWIVDEVPSPDAVVFTANYVSGGVPPEVSSSLFPNFSGTLSRSFGLPDYLQAQQVYQYRVCAQTLDGQISNYCDPITVTATAQLGNPASFSASLLNAKVTPVVVRLQWEVDALAAKPDHWRLERKTNASTDTYRVIGNAYLDNMYFDRTAQLGQTYVYRIRSVSAVGDESDTKETSISC